MFFIRFCCKWWVCVYHQIDHISQVYLKSFPSILYKFFSLISNGLLWGEIKGTYYFLVVFFYQISVKCVKFGISITIEIKIKRIILIIDVAEIPLQRAIIYFYLLPSINVPLFVAYSQIHLVHVMCGRCRTRKKYRWYPNIDQWSNWGDTRWLNWDLRSQTS